MMARLIIFYSSGMRGYILGMTFRPRVRFV